MEFEQFSKQALLPNRYNLRDGQRFMIYLSFWRPRMHRAITGGCVDPRYDDTRLPAAMAYVQAHWHDSY
jgi:hypothetical protein